jgi:hypothetical protein
VKALEAQGVRIERAKEDVCEVVYPESRGGKIAEEITDGSIASFIASRYTLAPGE